jgi:integrase
VYTFVYTVAIVTAMPKSREHGQGALYWVESRKMWRAVLDVGFDETTGKRVQKARMSKSKDEAVKKLNAMIRERDSLGMVMDRSTRVAELAEAWLADVADRAKPKTLTNYRSNVRTKVLPSLGRRVVSELTPADVRRMHAAIRATGAGYSSVASAHRTLVTMLEYAKSERVVSGENVAMLAPPRRGRVGKAKDSFTREQARALLRVEDARVTLGLLTGLRSGEAMALRWEDIDFERAVAELSWSLTEASFQHGCNGTCGKIRAGNCPQRLLEISDSLEAIPLEGRLVLVRPKNDTPRQIPLTPAAVEQLQKLRDTDKGLNLYGLIWHRPTGAPRTNTDDNAHLRAVLSQAEIDEPAATTHWLRHTYVTLSEHAGIPWAAAAGVSGHGSPEASDPYRHVLTSEGRRAVHTLAAWVEKQ